MFSVAHINDVISDDSLADILSGLVGIPSPTGEEAPLAAHIVQRLDGFGIASETQPIDERQANAVGKIAGTGSGKTLLLYAPIDTVTSNCPEEDVPWAASEFRDDLQAKAHVTDGCVIGLGAHNPKGHAACIIEAGRVLKKMDVKLDGDIHFGFGAGGMPTHGRAGFRRDSGHGTGCAHMIKHLPKIDGAIVAKSGTSVTWEEAGFIWLEVTVSGKHNYVGARHLMPYDNAIANASRLILALEDWFETYAKNNASEFTRPQGHIAFMESGWKRMPAFTPEAARFIIDLRFGPNLSADKAESQFSKAFEQFCSDLNIHAKYERIQTINASRTAATDTIIQTTVKAWEDLQGKPHQNFTLMSGSTDANILRGHGIPTARIGLAKSGLPNMDFALGMNSVFIAELRLLTALLLMSAAHYCSGESHG